MNARYRGWMPTRMLRDDAIQPTEYRRWAEAEKRFARREKDAKVLAELLATVPREGLRKPILLGVDDLDHRVYVSDGHHRAIAVRQLGAPRFPFTWCWIRAYRVEHATDPFPYHLLGLEATA